MKDLEVELETDRQKSKENLQQAILIERERFTQMQWDMEELRQKSLEMEAKLKSNPEKVQIALSCIICSVLLTWFGILILWTISGQKDVCRVIHKRCSRFRER